MTLFSPPTRFSIPVVAVLCAAWLTLYGLWATGQRLVTCDRLAPGQVQCQVDQSLLFGWLPTTTTQFWLQDVAIDSTMCDNTPRGGVRFCHRVTLLGDSLGADIAGYRTAQTLPEIRTPLSTATVHDKYARFINGEGQEQLTVTIAGKLSTYIRTGILGVLLTIVAWGFWDIKWPSGRGRSWATDGAEKD